MRSRPSLRLLFCGTPRFAVASLEHLLERPEFDVVAVVTQPDRRRGRGQEVSYSPVKQTALAANLPVFQPEKIRSADSEQFLRDAHPDAIVIIAYGQIIPAHLLAIPRLGWINAHASLLPKYRGAAPIQWAIASGESATGITTMRIDAGMDTGDILLQREIPIGPDETTPQLADRLAALSATLLVETLRALSEGTLQPAPQDHSQATLAPLLKKEGGRIDWSLPAQSIYNRMRAFAPWPGAYTTFRGTTCHLSGEPFPSTAAARSAAKQSELEPGNQRSPTESAPGTIHKTSRELLVTCGQKTLLRLSSVKPEGRKEVSVQEFANGVRLHSGEVFI